MSSSQSSQQVKRAALRPPKAALFSLSIHQQRQAQMGAHSSCPSKEAGACALKGPDSAGKEGTWVPVGLDGNALLRRTAFQQAGVAIRWTTSMFVYTSTDGRCTRIPFSWASPQKLPGVTPQPSTPAARLPCNGEAGAAVAACGRASPSPPFPRTATPTLQELYRKSPGLADSQLT